MDNLDFLDGSPEPNAEPTQETPAAVEVEAEQVETPETAEQKATRERDDKGRFKAKEADDPVMVPLKALHETRDEVKALKAELERMRQPTQQPQSQVPDIFEDPEGYVAYQNAQLQTATVNTTLNISEEMTRQSAGSETVDEAQKWGREAFSANPAFYQQFISQRNPYGFLVEHYKRASALAKLGDDPTDIDAYVAWRQAQTQPAQATPQQPTPTGSIASAPSAGGIQHVATGPGAAFDSSIK